LQASEERESEKIKNKNNLTAEGNKISFVKARNWKGFASGRL
jgi:hypothetical protein